MPLKKKYRKMEQRIQRSKRESQLDKYQFGIPLYMISEYLDAIGHLIGL